MANPEEQRLFIGPCLHGPRARTCYDVDAGQLPAASRRRARKSACCSVIFGPMPWNMTVLRARADSVTVRSCLPACR